MPLLDIAAPKPSFRNHLYSFNSQTLYHANDKRLSYLWRSFDIPEKVKNLDLDQNKMRCRGLLIKAVATLEPNCSTEKNVRHDYHRLHLDSSSKSPYVFRHQSSSEDDSTELDEREKLRRMRISKANKGNTPWNKGRKHTPETLQRIRERTRLAMQDPKIKMKLANLGHAQSEETRMKIGVGVRIGWNRRREKLMLQETCHFEWQNLIADASRRGLVGEEELQWDSYEILDEQLEQEWLASIEQRKKTPRPQGSKRAPKSAEQRRKISEAIAAKWADPAYRDRVYSGLSKYHGTPVGLENPRRRPTSGRQPIRTSPTKKKDNMDNSSGNEAKSQNQRTRLKKSMVPLYKDPLANTKLEMIKNIRAERENKKTEAITRAKLLIAEAEKAANALEVAAAWSPLAQASLVETWKLIAEAIQSMKSIETGEGNSDENGQNLQCIFTGSVNNVEKEIDIAFEGLLVKDQMKVNGARALTSYEGDISELGFEKFNLQDLMNPDNENIPTSSCDGNIGLSQLKSGHTIEPSSNFKGQLNQFVPNGSNRHENLASNGAKSESGKKEKTPKSIPITKKWVRGKLVEVT